MNHSLVIFFFAKNNHLSNVMTLQSIYRQDYPEINLIVCNDATYGFESERLLYNFIEKKPDNIRQVFFCENRFALGDFWSQKQLWDRICPDYYYVIHAGEYLDNPSALRSCIAVMQRDLSVGAVLAAVSLWSDDMRQKISDIFAVTGTQDQILHFSENSPLVSENIRDCMLVYRFSVLRDLDLDADNEQICRFTLPLIMENHHVAVVPHPLCRYSQASITSREKLVPTEFGNVTLKNIAALLQQNSEKATEPSNMIFQSALPAPEKKKRNIYLILHKLSAFTKIRGCAVIALLLFIAAALYLNMDTPVGNTFGTVFLVCAFFAGAITIGLLGCNLYFKRNPQRLVR